MDQQMPPVLVIGAGYVGLPYAAVLARGMMGVGPVPVVVLDRSGARCAQILLALEQGQDPLGEPHLGKMIRDASVAGGITLRAGEAGPAVAELRPVAIIIAVGTPAGRSEADDARVEVGLGLDCRGLVDVVREVGRALALHQKGPPVPVIVRSTFPPQVVPLLEKALEGSRGVLVVAPEFLREGSAVADLCIPSRTVIGLRDHTQTALGDQVRDLLVPQGAEHLLPPETFPVDRYGHAQSSVRGWRPVHFLLPEEACLVKLGANALLTLKITLASQICSALEGLEGGSADAVLSAIGADPRIGMGGLHPGLGPAGPCLPKDWEAFTRAVDLVDPESEIRNLQSWPWPDWDHVDEALILGVGFKPTSKDWRHGQAIPLARATAAAGLQVRVWDPRQTETERGDLDAELSTQDRRSITLLSEQPDALQRGTVVYLFYLPPPELLDWLLCQRILSWICDPYALLTPERVAAFQARGHGYLGRGRGAGWAARRTL